MAKSPYQSSLSTLVRQLERTYISGVTTISKYVQFQMLETLDKIDAYINSKHITGETDSLGRDKPFFNIVVAARNIWYRATDLDRRNIKVKATKNKDIIDSFLASIYLQNWMRKVNFGAFLNEWGRILATYGSAVTKFVDNDEGLNCMNVPWNRLIVDSVDFDKNLKIEILELTEAELKSRKGYDPVIVEKLLNTLRSRETVEKQRKDTRNYYVKLYEVHGNLPVAMLTGKESDMNVYTQQMHVITYLARKDSDDFDDFTLVSGREKQDPYMITHLIKEDGRTLGIGSVEHLFESQWMQNHTAKSIKDQLDLASKLIFQTSDGSFVGQNALSAIEQGDILIHAEGKPLTQIQNNSHDITSLQAFGTQWKDLANELNGISEAMLGSNPPSGTPWRLVQDTLQESYSLFSLMVENKGLALEDMLRKFILPYIKEKDLDHKDQIVATLNEYDVTQIDATYIKNTAIKLTNERIIDSFAEGKSVSPEEQQTMLEHTSQSISDMLKNSGNQRFFAPDEIGEKTWKEQFKNLEWEVEVDITGEDSPDKDDLTTLSTVLQTIATNPAVLTDPNAKLIFNKILTIAGAISPLQLTAAPPQQPQISQPQPSNIQPQPTIPGR